MDVGSREAADGDAVLVVTGEGQAVCVGDREAGSGQAMLSERLPLRLLPAKRWAHTQRSPGCLKTFVGAGRPALPRRMQSIALDAVDCQVGTGVPARPRRMGKPKGKTMRIATQNARLHPHNDCVCAVILSVCKAFGAVGRQAERMVSAVAFGGQRQFRGDCDDAATHKLLGSSIPRQ